MAESKPLPTPLGQAIRGLSPQVISRHMPTSSAGEVLPGLWVGNLMAVSHLGDLAQNSNSNDGASNSSNNKTVDVTVISILSNPNLIRLATDLLEQQRLQHANKDATHNHLSIYINHVIIPLKDVVESDLLSVLPTALTAIDKALGKQIIQRSPPSNASTSITKDKSCAQNELANTNSNERSEGNLQSVCLVHCAKGASRSVSVIIAYLLSRHSDRFKTLDEALQHIRTVRPHAAPNIGFVLALRRFERELLPTSKRR